MNKTLKLINNTIANKNPNAYANVSYNTYYQDMTKISNSIIDEFEDIKTRDIKLLIEVNKLPECASKFKLLDILQNK